jgi:uncharacterized membrane protein
MTDLGGLSGSTNNLAHDASADGSIIVGVSGHQAFRWEGGVMTRLEPPTGLNLCGATGVSADGSIVVGGGAPLWGLIGGGQAVRWDNGAVNAIGTLAGEVDVAAAYAVSADGSVIVGVQPVGTAARWENGVLTLLDSGPGYIRSMALGVSADGSVAVGMRHTSTGANEGCFWRNGVVTGLGALTEGDPRGMGVDASADGSVIIGTAEGDTWWINGGTAFLWTADEGMRRIRDVLMHDCGLDLTGWQLTGAVGISDDGMTIVGNGINPSGLAEPWIAHVPEPATACAVAVGGLILLHRRRFRAETA